MQLIDRFNYKALDKHTYPSGARHYICPISGSKLPSVTTILDKTAPNKKELMEWRQRVGDVEADRIKKESLALGTLMHIHLENYIRGTPRPGGTNTVRIMAERMADQVIERGFTNVEAVFGSEVHLYVPELYAGTCDCIGLWRGRPTVLDFKTARKIRSRDMIQDYLAQICAYGVCHDELYGTEIDTGVVFMVDRDYNYQEFVIEGEEFKSKKSEWFDRLETFLRSDFQY